MKRILALDGGGIRGVWSLQILRRIESLLREHTRRPDLVLADEFDLFAGTSTGAIIAACLCWGMSVADIEQLYLHRGHEMFSPQPWYRRLWSKYRGDALADFFQGFFTELDGTPALLSTSRLRKLLLVVTRNASTGSPWPLTNNPAAMYNDPQLPGCNLKIPLWRLLRASTAAPTFFPPEQIELAENRHLFVDGGITPFNNPSLLAVLTATLPPYRIGWPTGVEQLHVISVGTGLVRAKLPKKRAADINMIDQLRYIVPALLTSVSMQQDALCRVLGDCVHGDELDSEIGALGEATLLPAAEQKFTYARYDEPWHATPGTPTKDPELDNLALMPALIEQGRTYAERAVKRGHLFPRGRPPGLAT